MILKNKSNAKNKRSDEGSRDNLLLTLGSLQFSPIGKQTLEIFSAFPSGVSIDKRGSYTQRDDTIQQKKLNSSVLPSRVCSTNSFKKNIIATNLKCNQLSIVRTVSLAYATVQPKISNKNKIHYIRKSLTFEQTPKIANSNEFNDHSENAFMSVRKIMGQFHEQHEHAKRNKSLIYVNHELLKAIQIMQAEAEIKDQQMAGLHKQLKDQNKVNEQLKRRLISQESDRKKKQDKLSSEMQKSEMLVREINKLKQKLRENLIDLQTLRTDNYDQHLRTRTRSYM